MSWTVWAGILVAYLVFSRVIARLSTGSWLGTPMDFNDQYNVPRGSRGVMFPDDHLILYLRKRYYEEETA